MKLFRKVTFAFAVSLLFAASGFAENCLLGPCKKADLPTCGSKLKGRNFDVTNCVSAISCSTTASPGFAVRMVCDYTGSAWAYRAVNATAGASDLTGYAELASATSTAFAPGTDFTVTPTAGGFVLNAVGAGKDGSLIVVDDLIATGTDFLPTFSGTAVITAPVTNIAAATSSTVTAPVTNIVATTSSTTTSPIQVNTASTSILNTTPIFGVSGVYEHKVTNVTVADDAAGTKPAGVIPITTDYATCTCNDATGCAMSIAEPSVTSGYGRLLVIASVGTGNCEFTYAAGVLEIGTDGILAPAGVLTLAYLNSAWYKISGTLGEIL